MDPDLQRERVTTARVARLATITPEGRPHVVPCCFALQGDVVWSAVDAKPKSTHALRRLENLRANPAASLLVDYYEERWANLWWIRLDGDGWEVDDAGERATALEALASKYPQYAITPPPGPVLRIDVTAWRAWP